MNATEKAIRDLVYRIVGDGYHARVMTDDGEVLQRRTYDVAKLIAAIGSTDESKLWIYRNDTHVGTIFIVLNCNDADIVCDCTNEPEILRLADLA